MKEWLAEKWKTKSGYIVSLIFLMIFAGAKFALSDMALTHEEIGKTTGAAAAFVVWFGLVVLVDVKNIKVRNPKDKFVEPSQLKIGIFWLAGMFVAAAVSILSIAVIDAILVQVGIEGAIYDTEGILGNAVMMFFVLSVFISPFTVYMLNAKLRYKRIVEYKTAEWTRLQNRSTR